MNKDNKVFANDSSKKFSNNEKLYYSMDNRVIKKEEHSDNRNIQQKIKDIFTSRNYVYKADVIITVNGQVKEKRIIGRNNQYLITSENELIPIATIEDIKYQ